jgi:hypothetical protein
MDKFEDPSMRGQMQTTVTIRVVHTQTLRLAATRRGVMELYLSDHPLERLADHWVQDAVAQPPRRERSGCGAFSLLSQSG